MSWTADGSALADHTTFVRVLNEGGNAKRGINPTVGYRDGEWSTAVKYYGGADILLEVGLIHSDAQTHLSELKKMLGKSTGLVTLQRTDHAGGTVEAEVELLTAFPTPTQDRFTYLFPLRNPKGFWKDASYSTASGTSFNVTTSGDRPVDDAIITFSAAGSVTRADAAYGTATIAYGGAGTAVVDCGQRTVTSGGSAVDADLEVSDPFWLRLREDATNAITATASVTIQWKNSWA